MVVLEYGRESDEFCADWYDSADGFDVYCIHCYAGERLQHDDFCVNDHRKAFTGSLAAEGRSLRPQKIYRPLTSVCLPGFHRARLRVGLTLASGLASAGLLRTVSDWRDAREPADRRTSN
jgi:hypothetical protein